MSGSTVKKFTKIIKEKGLDGLASLDENSENEGLVEVMKFGNKYLIYDGHHRVQAAINAGLTEIPVSVTYGSRSTYEIMMKNAAEAKQSRGNY